MAQGGWTDRETALLQRRFSAGVTHREIAAELGRSRQAVGYRLNSLGIWRRERRQGDHVARFWSYVKKGEPNECWLWTGPTFDYGYGMFSVWPRVVGAHRFSMELAGVVFADGEVAMHSCDTPLCVNPAHLTAGTHAENEADKMAKGRQARGERHGCCRYSADQIEEVRRMISEGSTRKEAAQQTGVKLATVHRVAVGTQWKEVVRR